MSSSSFPVGVSRYWPRGVVPDGKLPSECHGSKLPGAAGFCAAISPATVTSSLNSHCAPLNSASTVTLPDVSICRNCRLAPVPFPSLENMTSCTQSCAPVLASAGPEMIRSASDGSGTDAATFGMLDSCGDGIGNCSCAPPVTGSIATWGAVAAPTWTPCGNALPYWSVPLAGAAETMSGRAVGGGPVMGPVPPDPPATPPATQTEARSCPARFPASCVHVRPEESVTVTVTVGVCALL